MWGLKVMSLDRLVGSALKVPLFYGLPEAQMSALLHRAERVVYYPGEYLIESGTFGDAAFLIVSGRGSEIHPLSPTQRFEPVAPGALVGEMAMLIETQHHVDVIADETIKAVRFSRELIQTMMAESPDLADHFVRTIARRLSDLAAEMRHVSSGSTATRPDHLTPAASGDVPPRSQTDFETGNSVQSEPGPTLPSFH